MVDSRTMDWFLSFYCYQTLLPVSLWLQCILDELRTERIYTCLVPLHQSTTIYSVLGHIVTSRLCEKKATSHEAFSVSVPCSTFGDRHIRSIPSKQPIHNRLLTITTTWQLRVRLQHCQTRTLLSLAQP